AGQAPADPATAAQGDGAVGVAASHPGVSAGKGRPTPKRSEAEKRRRQPYSAPADRKAALAQTRTRDREGRARKFEAMRKGEDWALAAKDRGPVRALARDVVDSQRRVSEYYMYIVGVLVILLFLPQTRLIVDWIVLGVIVVMLAEAVMVRRRVKRLAAERLPGESVKGIGRYAALRSMQIRKLRTPAPRVKPGATV
ncbi:MAG: DUF3043 domain-containing protein, partial [Actinomycetota bacterium]